MKTILCLTFALLLGGCLRGNSSSVQDSPAAQLPAGVPQSLQYNGQTYRLQHWDGESGEYYLRDERDYDWSKLLTLMFVTEGKTFDDFAANMERLLKQENVRYRLDKEDGALQLTMLYPPQPRHPHFAGYESNLMRYQPLPCGFAGLQYGEQHPATADGARLFTAAENAQQDFQPQAAQILATLRCPDSP